jgi:lysophospholipase L1-like esterase
MIKKWMRIAAWSFAVLVLLVSAFIAHLYFAGRPQHGRPQYVAMGSSFAAGPAITGKADDSPWFCMQSRDNYAHQLAAMRGLSLVDMSCGGAKTKDILDGGLALLPPQIGAVSDETELVTITIGGNDIGYVGALMAMGCDDSARWYLRAIGGCTPPSIEQMQQRLPKLHQQLVAIIDQVRQRAPKAQIVLLNYQTILPDSGSCARLGISEQQAEQMRGIAAQLAGTTAAAAQQRGVLLMDAMQLSQGHDVCAAQPWINATHPAGGLMAAPLHPTLQGMTATAQSLNALLTQAPPASE